MAQQVSQASAVATELVQLYAGTDAEAEDLRRRRTTIREERIRQVVATLDRLASVPGLSPGRSDPDAVAWDVGEGDTARLDWTALQGADPATDPHLLDCGKRKRLQLESLLQILKDHVFQQIETRRSEIRHSGNIKIVDFAAGTGHFGLLLAAVLPHCTVTLVDTDEELLGVARNRAATLGPAVSSRVTICCCPIADYNATFDVAVCLHGCGTLTDDAIARAVRHNAAFCCVPCCYSELLAPQSAAFAAQDWLDTAAFQQLSRAAEHPGRDHF